nr:hypothetical protein BaRGS_000648 [Batillaria attramentaria]
MSALFVRKELEDALKTLRLKKAPNSDNITSEMLMHLGPQDKKKLLQLFSAFRQDQSTEDQVTFISQATEDAFQEKKNTLALWIDLEKAFGKLQKNQARAKIRLTLMKKLSSTRDDQKVLMKLS